MSFEKSNERAKWNNRLKFHLLETMIENGKFDEINDLQKELIRNNKDSRNVSSLVKKETLERIGKINELKRAIKVDEKYS
jgi:hypothetical protein